MDAAAFPPAVIADARDAAKTHLRIETTDEDVLIEELAAAALALGERFTGTAWIAREWQEMLPAMREWRMLATAPVNAISAVEAVAVAGDASPLSVDDLRIDIDAQGRGWLRTVAPDIAGRLRVTINAGAAAGWSDLAPPLRQGIVLLTAHLFGNRERDEAPPAAVAALWRPWRRMAIGSAVQRA